jgi:threonine aldolase
LEVFYLRSFASDNNAGVHPKIMEAIIKANEGHVLSYGDDTYTRSAIDKFKQVFGDVDVYFVYNGTGANVLGLTTVTHSFNSIICPQTAHINVDECGAPEKFSGCKLITLDTEDGKTNAEQIKKQLHVLGDQHHSQPKVISITQATELGTVYGLDELKELTDFAHKNGLLVHMDGARIANAAAFLGVGLKEATKDVGIDILSFGGTKNGMMFGEAVVFFNKSLSKDSKFYRKQGMQLASKMRFISAQFDALLTDNLWLKNAKNANTMAKLLEQKLKGIPQVKIVQKVESNAVFAIIPKDAIAKLQKEHFFYVWNEEKSMVRWLTAFDTTQEDVEGFANSIKNAIG